MNSGGAVRFLRQVQTVLDEGGFVATYKFALLQALADLCVETADDATRSLCISINEIAEKFIEYYWNQARPFLDGETLRASTRGQAAVVNLILACKKAGYPSLGAAKRNPKIWSALVTKVSKIVIEMPLWRLQNVGNQQWEFLYKRSEFDGESIHLSAPVPSYFRAFHPMLTSMIRGRWVSHVKDIKENRRIIGPSAQLEPFLFSVDRKSLSAYRSVLRDYQHERCFYCSQLVSSTGALDHFIPWDRYPTDLGHSFVFSCARCNRSKSNHLPSLRHRNQWLDRNIVHGAKLSEWFDRHKLMHDVHRSKQVANWAYEQAAEVAALLWVSEGAFELYTGD